MYSKCQLELLAFCRVQLCALKMKYLHLKLFQEVLCLALFEEEFCLNLGRMIKINSFVGCSKNHLNSFIIIYNQFIGNAPIFNVWKFNFHLGWFCGKVVSVLVTYNGLFLLFVHIPENLSKYINNWILVLVMWSQLSQCSQLSQSTTIIVATPITIVTKTPDGCNSNHNCRNLNQPQLLQHQSQMSQYFWKKFCIFSIDFVQKYDISSNFQQSLLHFSEFYFKRLTLQKLWECVTVTRFLSQLSQIFSAQLQQFCKTLTIVAMLSWKIETFVTAWLFKCNWIDLRSMGVLRFFWIWTANHIAGLNYSSANGVIHPDYGRQFQAMAEFGSGRFLTTLAVQPSASTCPCTKANGKKAR